MCTRVGHFLVVFNCCLIFVCFFICLMLDYFLTHETKDVLLKLLNAWMKLIETTHIYRSHALFVVVSLSYRYIIIYYFHLFTLSASGKRNNSSTTESLFHNASQSYISYFCLYRIWSFLRFPLVPNTYYTYWLY